MNTILKKLSRKSLTWWGVMLTGVGVFVALAAWLWPEPLKTDLNIAPTPTPLGQTVGINQTIPTKAPEKIRIVVLKFDEVSQLNYRVTDLVLAKLRDAMSKYPDTEIIFVDRIVTEAEGSGVALKIGQLYSASIVVWGWYGLTDQTVPLGVHFDIVPTSGIFISNTCAASSSEIEKVARSHLSDLTLQTNLSNELTYLTLFTLGLSRFEIDDFSGALNYFNDAIENYDPNTTLSAITDDKKVIFDVDLLYDYRGTANIELGNYDSALSDFEKINQDGNYNVYVADIYKKEGDYESALEYLDTVINGNYSSGKKAKAYYLHGSINDILGMKTQANQDYRKAIETNEDAVLDYVSDEFANLYTDTYYNNMIYYNPQNFLAYYFRAVYYEDKDIEKSLSDYDKALELFPSFPAAQEGRIDLLRSKDVYDHQYIINEYENLFSYPDYHTPCNFIHMGWEKRYMGLSGEGNKYYEDAVSRATDEINEDPTNGYAYYVRGLAFEDLGEYENALRDYQKIKELDPKSASEYEIDTDIYELTLRNTNPLIVFLSLIIPIAVIFGAYQIIRSSLKRYMLPRHTHTKKH